MNDIQHNSEWDLRTSHQGDQHGTSRTIKQWERLTHYMLYVRCAAFFDILAREFLAFIPLGRPDDIQFASRRQGQREMKKKRSNVANLLETQWVRGKASPKSNWGTPWEKAPNECEHPPSAIQKRRQPGDVLQAIYQPALETFGSASF